MVLEPNSTHDTITDDSLGQLQLQINTSLNLFIYRRFIWKCSRLSRYLTETQTKVLLFQLDITAYQSLNPNGVNDAAMTVFLFVCLFLSTPIAVGAYSIK